ncbi:MAG: type II secretion system secretin GspD [Candidatus Rokubacteria bacterium]|nr:type II secretion system secretin GspD [Candidatus Rokubacteria bacterium]
MVAVVASLLAGCAGQRPGPRPPVAAAQLAPAPPVPAAPSSPPPEPPPPLSIGPRPLTAVEAPPGAPQPSPPPTVPPVPPGQRGRFIVLNFDNADIETVIQAASEIVGFNYVLAPDVRGKVTVQTSGRVPQEDVFGVLLAILEVHGFTAIKAGNLYKIVRIEGARERAVPTIVGPDPDPTRTTDEVITQIIPVRYTPVSDLASLVRPLISARGSLIAHRETNILIVTDAASNVRRLLEIIRLVDVEVALDELQIISIRYADAADLANILNQLFTSGRLRRASGAAGPIAPTPVPVPVPTPIVPGAPLPAAPGAAAGGTTGTERVPLIIAERRSNSLIIHARKIEMETLRRLIAQLDVNIYGGRRVFVYYAENAKAKDLAATLNAIYGGREPQSTTTTPGTTPSGQRTPAYPVPMVPPPPAVAPGAGPGGGGQASLVGVGETGVVEGQVRFIADETTNSIIVTTFPRNWTEIETTIKQLDKMPRQVLIEVLVAEITLTDDMRLGIDWALKTGAFRLAGQNINPSTPQIVSPDTGLPPATNPLTLAGGGLTALAFKAQDFFAMLNTLASLNRVNILSNPHVMTSENKKAVINVSDSIPIVTSQQVPIGGTTPQTATNTTSVIGTQSVEYRDAGVILTVTPRIGERGTVALEVKQEVNDIGAPEPPTGSRRIIKREAETTVVLLNNQTLVLGGLIRETTTIADRGIPFLKNIPIIGYLFGTKIRTLTKTELVLLITPRVIGSATDAARITDQMRRATPELDEAIRRAPRPPSRTPLPVPPGPGSQLAPPTQVAPPAVPVATSPLVPLAPAPTVTLPPPPGAPGTSPAMPVPPTADTTTPPPPRAVAPPSPAPPPVAPVPPPR